MVNVSLGGVYLGVYRRIPWRIPLGTTCGSEVDFLRQARQTWALPCGDAKLLAYWLELEACLPVAAVQKLADTVTDPRGGRKG